MCIAVEQQNGFLLQLMLLKDWTGNISSKAPPKHPCNLVEDNSTLQTQARTKYSPLERNWCQWEKSSKDPLAITSTSPSTSAT